MTCFCILEALFSWSRLKVIHRHVRKLLKHFLEAKIIQFNTSVKITRQFLSPLVPVSEKEKWILKISRFWSFWCIANSVTFGPRSKHEEYLFSSLIVVVRPPESFLNSSALSVKSYPSSREVARLFLFTVQLKCVLSTRQTLSPERSIQCSQSETKIFIVFSRVHFHEWELREKLFSIF